jgi:hypothetical protein
MSARHGNKRKKKTEHRPVQAVVNHARCQEHPDQRKEDHMKDADHNQQRSRLGAASFFISVLILLVYFTQAYFMRKAMRVDQRAWVSVIVPTVFPLNGTSIPVVTQITNSGKTPAKDVQGDVVATVLNKGEEPTLGDFSVGHPHNRLYAGVVFPGAPIPTTINVVRYGPKVPENIVPDDTLRQDIEHGNRFIIFYGRITYYDVFGIQHWTQFCTGSGTAILDNLKQCIRYNDVDNNEE